MLQTIIIGLTLTLTLDTYFLLYNREKGWGGGGHPSATLQNPGQRPMETGEYVAG